MRKFKILAASLMLISFISCKENTKETEMDENLESEMEMDEKMEEEVKMISLALDSKSESNAMGEAIFEEKNGMVSFSAKIEGLQPGIHAIHIHEKADCSATDGTSAGGHWNPTFENHGKWGDANGYHKGDIGNFEVGDDGIGSISVQTDEWCLGCDDDKKNVIGKSIIVHQGADDFTSQPSGAAGARVSCGGIIQ